MNNSGYVRPKQYIMYRYGVMQKCYIHCFPQQTFSFRKDTDSKQIVLSNEKRKIDLEISIEDFEKHWVEKSVSKEN